MIRFFLALIVAVLATTGNIKAVYAGAEPAPPEASGYYMGHGRDSELNQYAASDEVIIDDGYIPPTFPLLSQLYWKLAVFDLGDLAAIDNYLMINECELYTKYYNSDFELDELRAATRGSIVKNLASFANKFEVMIPIGLDRYDSGTERFKLTLETQFRTAKRLEVNVYKENAPTCQTAKMSREIPGYPANFILSLSRPFTLTEIPISPELAQTYIEESQKLALKHRYRYKVSPFGRLAYIRLKISMTQFRDYVRYNGSPLLADIFGSIDGYEIYADREKQFLLYKHASGTAGKTYRRKKLPIGNSSGADPAPAPAAQQETAPAETGAIPDSMKMMPQP